MIGRSSLVKAMRMETSRNIEEYTDFYPETYPEKEKYGY